MTCCIVWCVHWRESVLLVFLVSGCCKLMRTVEVCRWEGPVVLAAVDGGGRGWLFLDAIEEKASWVLPEVVFLECPMGHAGFGERLLLGFSQVVAHLRHEWNHAMPEGALRIPSLGVRRRGTSGRWRGLRRWWDIHRRSPALFAALPITPCMCTFHFRSEVNVIPRCLWRTTSSIWWSSITVASERFCLCPILSCFVFACPNLPCHWSAHCSAAKTAVWSSPLTDSAVVLRLKVWCRRASSA